MLSFIKKKSLPRDLILIVMGTFLMALAIDMIYDPMQMVTGGVAGLAIMIKYMTVGSIFPDGIPVWLTTLVCNIPLYIIFGEATFFDAFSLPEFFSHRRHYFLKFVRKDFLRRSQ